MCMWKLLSKDNDSFNESVFSFVNNINTPEGGTHLQGFRNAITKTFNDYARSAKLLKESEPNLSGEDIREGLTAIVSVKIEDPQFEGQTKQKPGTVKPEERLTVSSVNSLLIFWNRTYSWQRQSARNLFWHREPEKRRGKPEI